MRSTNNTTPLHQAALDGDYQKTLALTQDPKFNSYLTKPDYNKSLPLDRAAPRGHYQIVKLLVDAHLQSEDTGYRCKNKQGYTPFLSAVRWYLKVADGTYADKKCIGIFNTGENFRTEYLAIIDLLIEKFPGDINISDRKRCNAMYYVIHHLGDAREKKDANLEKLITQLALKLLRAGVSIDEPNYNQITPRSLAKKKNVLHTIEALEKKASLTQSAEMPVKISKEESVVDPVGAKIPASKEESVVDLVSPRISTSESDNLKSEVMSPNSVTSECDMENVSRHPTIKKRRRPTANSLFSSMPKVDSSQMVNLILQKVKENDEYQYALTHTIEAELTKQLTTFLNQHKKNFDFKEMKNLVSELSECFDVQIKSSGVLCWKKTVSYLTFNEFAAEIVLSPPANVKLGKSTPVSN